MLVLWQPPSMQQDIINGFSGHPSSAVNTFSMVLSLEINLCKKFEKVIEVYEGSILLCSCVFIFEKLCYNHNHHMLSMCMCMHACVCKNC